MRFVCTANANPKDMKFPKVLGVAPLTLLHSACAALRKYPRQWLTPRVFIVGLLVSVALCLSVVAESQRPALITSLKVDLLPDKIMVYFEADRTLSIQATVLTHPDRIVLDAAGALFKIEKPVISINTGPVKSVRIGLLQSQPPVTRIVVDTFVPLAYALRTAGKSAFLDIPLQPMHQTPVVAVAVPPVPPNVIYERGLLTIVAENCSLAEILNAVHFRIGGMTEFPASAANERATVKLGPAPPATVLAALLLGSPFDYVIVGSEQPEGIQVFLSEKTGGADSPAPVAAVASVAGIPTTNDSAGSAVSGLIEAAAAPSDGTQFLINQAAIPSVAGENAFSAEGGAPTSPDAQPRSARPSRETPRVPPPGKGRVANTP